MFVYSRKVSFIDYYINGIKSGNIGVVRQIVADEKICFNAELFGLEKWRNGQVEISVGSSRSRKKLFEIEIKGGKGKGECTVPVSELKNVEEQKIIFAFENDCYGIADLCDLSQVVRDTNIDEIEAEKEDVTGREEGANTADMTVCETAPAAEPEESELSCEETDEFGQEADELLAECMEPQPDKWEVIKKKYPILYPFRGQGPYVSIKPVDLQLLSNKYHHLSSNSYLMHGFYRYRHMILGEYSQEKGTFFYVGVPGEFVKKEQTSAAMFGFEGYEHSGDLGYYLYRVEL